MNNIISPIEIIDVHFPKKSLVVSEQTVRFRFDRYCNGAEATIPIIEWLQRVDTNIEWYFYYHLARSFTFAQWDVIIQNEEEFIMLKMSV